MSAVYPTFVKEPASCVQAGPACRMALASKLGKLAMLFSSRAPLLCAGECAFATQQKTLITTLGSEHHVP